MSNTTADHAPESDNARDNARESVFVSGIAASERPSAKMKGSVKKQDEKRLVPLRDFGKDLERDPGKDPQNARPAPLRDAGNGRLAIADVTDGEFEPMWGVEAKPRSQRETFLAEQAFAQGKKEGEEQMRKIALAEGLKEGRESGYKQGFHDGNKERVGEVEQRAQQLAEQITDQRIKVIAGFLEQLMQREKEASHKRDTELMALMISIFDKILPALSQEHGEQEVQHFLQAILQRFENIPQITITLAEEQQALAEQLRKSVDAVLPDDKSVDTLVSFHFDPSFSKADCKIAWAEGEVERRFQNLWEEVKHALQQHMPHTASDILETRLTEQQATDARSSEESGATEQQGEAEA